MQEWSDLTIGRPSTFTLAELVTIVKSLLEELPIVPLRLHLVAHASIVGLATSPALPLVGQCSIVCSSAIYSILVTWVCTRAVLLM